MITLQLDKSQVPHFIKMIVIGEWILNSSKQENEADPDIRECAKNIYRQLYDQKEQQFFDDREYPKLNINLKYLDEWLSAVEEYSQEDFWDILAEHLAERDIFQQYSENELKKFSHEELRHIFFQKFEYYENEFNKNGIDNLVVVPSLPDDILHSD